MSFLGAIERRVEAGCDGCFFKPPNNDRNLKVGSRGDPKSRFVIIGESPGFQEVCAGAPFVGPSGNLLEQIMAEFNPRPDEAPYILNAIKCFPCGKKSSENLAYAAQQCRRRLLEELTAYPRDVILTLGAAALQTTTDNWGLKVTRERGRVFQSPYARSGVVASVHPAFLLRGAGNLKQFRSDIELAYKLLRQGAPNDPRKIRYTVLERPSQVRALARILHTLPPEDIIVSDIETTGVAYLRHRMLSTGVMFRPDFVYIIPAELSIPELWNAPARYVWHNGKFDIKFHHMRGEPARCDEDTMLASYAINERRGIHGLDQLGIDHLKIDPHKGMIDEYLTPLRHPDGTPKDYGDIPREVLYKYQAIDIAKTYWAHLIVREKVREDPHAEKLYTKLLMPASAFLTKVEKRGITVDVEWTQKNNEHLERDCQRYADNVNEVSQRLMGYVVNTNSYKQLQQLLYGTLKLGPLDKSTDKDALLDILRNTTPNTDAHTIVESLLIYRGLFKQWRTYTARLINDAVDKKGRIQLKDGIPQYRYIQSDGKTHATYLLHGTGTGRLSSRDPNNQNQPRDPIIRGQYIASIGRIFIEPDLSQAELRSLACLSFDNALIEIFCDSERSLHNEVATQLFGAGFSGEEKMIAKNVNFGIVYGITAIGLYLQLVTEGIDNITIQECQEWLDGWRGQFPEAAAYIEKCRQAPLLRQNIVTCFGRKKRHGVVSRERIKAAQDEASNFPHQSIASDIVLDASMNIDEGLSSKYDANIINLVHDSNLTELPNDGEKVRQVAQIIMNKFTEVPARMGLTAVPFKSECKIGIRWGAAKDVRTHDIRMKSGKLLRAHPEWVVAAHSRNEFMQEWDPTNDSYPNYEY